MRTINLTLTNQTLTLNSLESLPVQGSENSIKLKIAFDSSWSDYPTRRAYFQYFYSSWIYEDINEQGEVVVPTQVLAKGGFKVLVKGESQNGTYTSSIENIPVDFAPSLANSTKVIPTQIVSGDDAISVVQEGERVIISLNDEFESNTYFAEHIINGTASNKIISVTGVELGETDSDLDSFLKTYTQVAFEYRFTIESIVYNGNIVADSTRYDDSHIYYVSDLIPLGENYTALVTLYLLEDKVKANISLVPMVLNLKNDQVPTANSINIVNSGDLYTTLESLKATLKAYSDANLVVAKNYSDAILVESKQYTDNKYNSLVGIITHETEVMEARISQAITQMQNQVNASITGMETTIQGELTALDTRVDEAISTMNTTISSSLTNMENTIQQELDNLDTRFSTLQTALEARITTLSNQIDSQFSTLQTQLEGRIDTLEGEVDDKLAELETYQEELDNKADVDGNYPTLTSGLSLLTKNVEAKTKIEDNEPYAVRVVPSGVAEDCLVNGVVGVDVVKNQLYNKFASDRADHGLSMVVSGTSKNQTLTFTADNTEAYDWLINEHDLTSGHKYLFFVDKQMTPNFYLIMFSSGTSPAFQSSIGNIFTAGGDRNYLKVYFGNGVNGTFAYKPKIIDLTQRYGNNEVVNAIIGSDTSTQVAKLLAFDPDILKNTEYDTGTLINVQVNGRKVTNANIWDEEWELGQFNSNGQPISSSVAIRSKSFCKCIPNTDYFGYWKAYSTDRYGIRICFYDKNQNFISGGYISGASIKSPTNAEYFKINTNPDALQVTTYKKDITINPSSPLINGTYISHKENTYPIQPIDLHGIFKVENGKVVAVGDYYPYTGKGKRRYVKINLGDLNWGKVSPTSHTFYAPVNGIKLSVGVINYACSKYTCRNPGYASDDYEKLVYGNAYSLTDIIITDSSYTDVATFKQAMNGVYLVYELATETDFEATPFTHIQKSYLDGTEEWLSPTNHINPPIPHETSYLPDLADKLELAPNNPNADGTYVVTRANGVNSYTPLNTWLTNNDYKQAKDLPTIEALGGTLRSIVSLTQNTNITNVVWIDLGESNWRFENGIFEATLTSTPKTRGEPFACTYGYSNSGESSSADMTNNTLQVVIVSNSGRIWVKDTTYTDATSFKNAMKGQLIAFEIV